MSKRDVAAAATAVARAAMIPESIGLHPRLNQAAKFLWIHLWQKAGFFPNTVTTSPAAIASQIGGSERAAHRWLKSLEDSGLIEFSAKPRRGSWKLYINSPPTHDLIVLDSADPDGSQILLPGHEPTGDSVPKTPEGNQERGVFGAETPDEKHAEIISLHSAIQQEKEADTLTQLIEERRRVTGIKPEGDFEVGTRDANCKLSKVDNYIPTMNREQLAQPAPNSEKKSEIQSSEPIPPPLGHPARPDVRATVDEIKRMGENQRHYRDN